MSEESKQSAKQNHITPEIDAALRHALLASTTEVELLDSPLGHTTAASFLAAIHQRTPTGQWIAVQHHPNGDWSVAHHPLPWLPGDRR